MLFDVVKAHKDSNDEISQDTCDHIIQRLQHGTIQWLASISWNCGVTMVHSNSFPEMQVDTENLDRFLLHVDRMSDFLRSCNQSVGHLQGGSPNLDFLLLARDGRWIEISFLPKLTIAFAS